MNIMNKNPQYNQQTELKQCKPKVEKICKYQNLETIAVKTAFIYENEQWVPCQKETQAKKSEIVKFSQQKVHLYLQLCSLPEQTIHCMRKF